MTNYGPYAAFDVEFDTGGHLVDPSQQEEALAFLGADDGGKAVRDVFVISHGWNNDMGQARDLYHQFFDSFGKVAATHGKTPQTYAVLALLWPSKKFADTAMIPGGAAATGDPLDAQLNAQLDLFKVMFADKPKTAANIEAARRLIPTLSVNPLAQDQYVQLIAQLIPPSRYEVDEGLDGALQTVANLQGRTVLKRLAQPVRPVGTSGTAGFNLGDSIKNGAAMFGNVCTYYTMKDRAGIVGRTGAVGLVRALQAASVPKRRVHLIGHSFGGRLVTALANALVPPAHVDSMTLLEAAYSHNGLATDWDGNKANGSFQAVLTNRAVQGPVLITHSAHDTRRHHVSDGQSPDESSGGLGLRRSRRQVRRYGSQRRATYSTSPGEREPPGRRGYLSGRAVDHALRRKHQWRWTEPRHHRSRRYLQGRNRARNVVVLIDFKLSVFRVSCGFRREVEASEMEIDGGHKVGFIAESTRGVFAPLDTRRPCFELVCCDIS